MFPLFRDSNSGNVRSHRSERIRIRLKARRMAIILKESMWPLVVENTARDRTNELEADKDGR